MSAGRSSSVVPVEPALIERFLLSRGWTELTRDPGRSAVFAKADHELRVPLDPAFADYAVRVRDVIEVLQETEDKSASELVAELSDPDSDVVVFRLRSSAIGPGTIDAREGLIAMTRSTELLAAAAASALTRRPSHRWSIREEDLRDYLSGVRLGPSEPGSYVVRFLVSPTTGEAHGAGLGRRLTTTLARSFRALTDPLVSDDDRETLLEAGVSAEMCFALSDLVARPQPVEIEVEFEWSQLRARDVELPSVYRFDPTAATHLRSVGEELGGSPYYSLLAPPELERALGFGVAASGPPTPEELEPPRPGVVIAGPVLALYGGGRVHIRAEVDGRSRTVRVELSDADYVEAIHAHERGWKVRVRGDLLERARIPILLSAHDFMVIDG